MIYWIHYKSTLPSGTCTSYGTDDYMVDKICTQGEDSVFGQEPCLWDDRPPIPWPQTLDCSPPMKIDHFQLNAIFLTIKDANDYSLFLEAREKKAQENQEKP